LNRQRTLLVCALNHFVDRARLSKDVRSWQCAGPSPWSHRIPVGDLDRAGGVPLRGASECAPTPVDALGINRSDSSA
jgi:hypothetical protein